MACSVISWTPLNQILYSFYASGTTKLATTSPDGSNAYDVAVSAGAAMFPSACGDGQHVLFTVNRPDQGLSVWRGDANAGEVQQLTKGPADVWPICSPDGKTGVYVNLSTDLPILMKIAIDGGTATRLGKEPSSVPGDFVRQPAHRRVIPPRSNQTRQAGDRGNRQRRNSERL